ncbi:MAG: hypothetical protein NC548_34760 [Lachnospiraceae bacterium]|nr:hypothetical protein [Lachnospiraceae bacterium]
MPQSMFEALKKHLSPQERKQFEQRHQELKRQAESRQWQQEKKLSEILDSETLMRFAYVPFVVAQLAWDYADTILDTASMYRLHETKKLCRAVKELKKRYDIVRDEFTNTTHRESEIDNMYVFEDGVADLFNLYLKNIEFDLKAEYPQLEEKFHYFLKAVYQCHIVLQAIYRYASMWKVKVEKIVGHSIGDVLPQELRKLDILVMAFVGDKPVSQKFDEQQKTYAQCIANRMALIELNETKEDE